MTSSAPDSERRTLSLLSGDARLDRLMHAADVFEPFKRLVDADERGLPRVTRLEVTFEAGRGTEADLKETVKTIRDTADGIRVIAVWFDGGPAWRDETCKIVSTGRAWVQLDAVLLAAGFPGSAGS